MDSLYPYYVRAMAGDRAAFAREFPYLFLVQRPEAGASDALGGSSFDEDPEAPTDTRGVLGLDARDSSPAPAGPLEWSVASIKKRPGFPPYNRIVVGRIPSCDVVIAHASVSKSHAQFHVGENRALSLSDKGSKLGTFLNDRKLAPDEVAPVRAGDRLQFGRVAFEVTDAAALYEILRAL